MGFTFMFHMLLHNLFYIHVSYVVTHSLLLLCFICCYTICLKFYFAYRDLKTGVIPYLAFFYETTYMLLHNLFYRVSRKTGANLFMSIFGFP